MNDRSSHLAYHTTTSFVDLHTHSTASDGTTHPDELVEMAHHRGLTGLSLTDHDTVAGIALAQQTAARLGVDFVPGIEISAEFPRPGTLHILGYGIDPAHPKLANLTGDLQASREQRNRMLIKKLNDLGIDLSYEQVRKVAGTGVMGRPHFAQAMVEIGAVGSTHEAFKVYLGQGGRAYLDKERLTARQAIDAIHDAGGLAVLAHPAQLHCQNDPQLRTQIKNLVDFGLDGIEVIHCDHRESLIDKLEDWARQFGLLTTGGSDFHGSAKRHIRLGFAGNRRIPRELFDRLRESIASRRGSQG